MGKKRTSAGAGGGAVDETTTTTSNNSSVDLKSLIREHSFFFDQLVELIPARFFLPYSGDDKPWFPGLSKSEKTKLKSQTRENIIKSRRDRLDPTVSSSTLDVLKRSLAEEKESSNEEWEEDGDEEKEEEEEEKEEEVGQEEMAPSTVAVSDERPVTYEELRERLRRKIAELAAGRNTRPESRLKQEKKKEMKNKKKLKVETKKNREKNKERDSDNKRKREDVNDEMLSKNKKSKVGEPSDITFGQVRIDGNDTKKRKKKLSKEKELERAKRLEEAKKDPEKGKKVSWNAAVSKAAGEKVHDDPKLLKQSIKRDKKRQQKNAQKWKEREMTVAKAKAEKQSKRSENIRERIHQKKMRKIEKREKKLLRPGFEGRKEGYLNE